MIYTSYTYKLLTYRLSADMMENRYFFELLILTTSKLRTRARTESIHFGSRKRIKKANQNLLFDLWFTWENHFIFDSDSFWFGLTLIRRKSRFTRESKFTCESKIKSNQKSLIGESWFTHCRIIGWFDFESKVNQSESGIKLVRALPRTVFKIWIIWYRLYHIVPPVSL